MRIKLKFIVVCITSLCISESLFSQTYITPQLGLNVHTLEFESLYNENYYIQNMDDRYDIGLGFDIKHYILPKWFLRLETICYLKKHTYTLHSFGINPRHDYTYRLANIELATGLKIIKQLEAGFGLRKAVLYSNAVKYTNGHIEDLPNSFYNSYLLFLSYSFHNMVIKMSYSNSIENKESMDIEMLSFSMGYKMKIFNSSYRSNRVKCPKIYN